MEKLTGKYREFLYYCVSPLPAIISPIFNTLILTLGCPLSGTGADLGAQCLPHPGEDPSPASSFSQSASAAMGLAAVSPALRQEGPRAVVWPSCRGVCAVTGVPPGHVGWMSTA